MSTRSALRQYAVAVRLLIACVVVLGIGYPLVVLGASQLVAPANANGSPVRSEGRTVGSALIGQSWTDRDGEPLRRWFQSRPSAAGDGYDAGASSGSNLGPENPALVTAVRERRAAVAAFEGVPAERVPADAVTASASGLDPDISPAYARLQVARVAAARGLPEARVAALVRSLVVPPDLGFVGEARVNVLRLNLALERMSTREAH